MLQLSVHSVNLKFRFKARTSRGVLTQKTSWFIKAWDNENPKVYGVGEAAPLKDLSIDDLPDFGDRLTSFSHYSNKLQLNLADTQSNRTFIPHNLPSLNFAMETALLDLSNGGKKIVYKNNFCKGLSIIPINGLVWMGSRDFMFRQIKENIQAGYSCIKMKIGTLDFKTELELLKYIRSQFSAHEITLRVDANGAFHPSEALNKLNQLTELDLHSIEQPIKQNQPEEMARLCELSPISIGLDEELIGINEEKKKEDLLDLIKPQYVILKPTLLGGFRQADEWIRLSEKRNIGWWITSSLESNVGLNAIAQFTAEYDPKITQGLGTGHLFHNNIPSPLYIDSGYIGYDKQKGTPWQTKVLDTI